MSMLKEFREFALKGNVVDLAVGVIIGAAFGTIVSSLVDDVVMPPIGLLLAGIDFSTLKLVLQQCIRDARQDVKTLVFAKMLWRARHHPDHLRPDAQPAAISAPPGFRLRRRRVTIFRLCTRGLKLRTFRDIQRTLHNIDRVVTRALNRAPMTFVTHVLVAAWIPACVFASCAPARAPEAADTS